MSELKATSLSHKDNNTGTPNITMYPDGTTSIGLTYTGGFKNQLINGSMQIAQRGAGPVSTSSQAGTYATVDRFTVDDVTSSQVIVNDLPGFPNALNLYGGGRYKVRQSVELAVPGNNCQFSLGSTWTVSLWSTDDLSAGNLSLYFTDDHSGSNFQAVAENLPWVAIETVSGSSNNWTRYSATFTVNNSPVATNNCLNVEMTLVNGLFTGIQLEPGPVATPFEQRPIGTEKQLCARYYWTSDAGEPLNDSSAARTLNTQTPSTPGVSSGVFEAAMVNFPEEMRATPSVTVLAPNGASGQVLVGSVGQSNVRFNEACPKRVRVQSTDAGTFLSFVVQSDAEL